MTRPGHDAEVVLEVRDIAVRYDRAALGVQGVTLEVPRGQIIAMLGANGAGKTTTLRAISGFLPSDSAELCRGSILFEGRQIDHLSPHRRVALGVALIPEREKVFRKLNVDENLRVSDRSRGKNDASTKELLEFVFDLFPALVTRRRTAAGYLSGGERQMLGIAKALMLRPNLLLADEVSMGIAPNLVVTMLDAIRRVNVERQTSVLLVEQSAPSAFRVADYVYILETGRVVLEGTPSDLLENPAVRAAYFGISGTSDEHVYGTRRAGRTDKALTWG